MAQTGRTLGAVGAGFALQQVALGAPFFLGGLGLLSGALIFLVSLRVLVPHTDRYQS
jgi:predicted MFS family arabinose efflux permease